MSVKELIEEWSTLGLLGRNKLHIRAQEGKGEQIPKQLLTEELLMLPDRLGTTVLHYLARYSALHIVDRSILTEKNLTTKNLHGSSVLHWAGLGKSLDCVPAEYLTEQNVCQINEAGETVIHCAARGNCMDVLDKFRTERYITHQCHSGISVLHLLANQNRLKSSDTAFLTETNLLLADTQGCTVMHNIAVAANTYQIELIPEANITKKVLTAKNSKGDTPLHTLAHWKHLDMIVAKITPEMLVLQNAEGSTPLEIISKNRTLDVINGIPIPEKYKDVVGEEWWERNNEAIKGKAQLNTNEETAELDIF